MHNFSKLYNFFSMSWNNTHFHTLIKKTECWILYRAFRISHQYSIESLRLCRYMIFVIECFKLWRFVRVCIFPFKIQLAKYVWFHLLRSFWDCTHQIKYVYTYKYIHTLSRYRHKRQTSVTCMSISLLSRYTHIGFWTTFIFKEFLIFQKWTNKCCTSSSLNWYETCTENIYFVFFSDYQTRILDELTIFFFGRQNLF